MRSSRWPLYRTGGLAGSRGPYPTRVGVICLTHGAWPSSELIGPIPAKRRLREGGLTLARKAVVFSRRTRPATPLGQHFNWQLGSAPTFGASRVIAAPSAAARIFSAQAAWTPEVAAHANSDSPCWGSRSRVRRQKILHRSQKVGGRAQRAKLPVRVAAPTDHAATLQSSSLAEGFALGIASTRLWS